MKTKQREPKYMGCGIYVHQQFRPEQLVKGDTFQDADFGEMYWNGAEWVYEEGNLYQPTVDAIHIGTVVYVPAVNEIWEMCRQDEVKELKALMILKWITVYKFNV